MSEPLIKGWCPGALRPMQSGDGWVVRVRPHGGRLTKIQADGIGRLALAHGDGRIDVTRRANVQLRGVTEQSYGALIEGLAALGLVDDSAEAEANRNIIVTPFWTKDDGIQVLASGLAAALRSTKAPRLPSKFGFAVDCGPSPVLGTAPADIRLERSADGTLLCRADGAATGAPVSNETAVTTALGLAQWFLETGGGNQHRGRMAKHLAAGTPLPDEFTKVKAQPARGSPVRPGPAAGGVLVGVEFGQLPAETLMALARMGALRLTPWRMVLIEGVPVAPTLQGLITEPDNPLLRVFACTGKPGCPQALQPTRDLARWLAAQLPETATLHVSGCSKGCAYAGEADVTLTAQSNGFDLGRRSRAGDAPQQRGLTARWLIDHPSVLSKEP